MGATREVSVAEDLISAKNEAKPKVKAIRVERVNVAKRACDLTNH
jgi:hypothetical protein